MKWLTLMSLMKSDFRLNSTSAKWKFLEHEMSWHLKVENVKDYTGNCTELVLKSLFPEVLSVLAAWNWHVKVGQIKTGYGRSIYAMQGKHRSQLAQKEPNLSWFASIGPISPNWPWLTSNQPSSLSALICYDWIKLGATDRHFS